MNKLTSMEKKIDAKQDKNLGKNLPGEGKRPSLGRGHEQPGLGSSGGHRNVVNVHSHAGKMKHD